MNTESYCSQSFDSNDLTVKQPTISDNLTLKQPGISDDLTLEQPAIGGDLLIDSTQTVRNQRRFAAKVHPPFDAS